MVQSKNPSCLDIVPTSLGTLLKHLQDYLMTRLQILAALSDLASGFRLCFFLFPMAIHMSVDLAGHTLPFVHHLTCVHDLINQMSPSGPAMLLQWWVIAGPTSTTSSQQSPTIGHGLFPRGWINSLPPTAADPVIEMPPTETNRPL